MLQPVVARDELLDVPIPQRRVAQRLRATHGFPTNRDPGVGQPLRDCLQTQCVPPGFTVRRNELAAGVQGVEVRADHVGVEDRRQSGPQQHWYFAERVLGEHLLVAAGRAGLVMNDFDLPRQADLVREHERLARIRRMRLIEQLHARILGTKPRTVRGDLRPLRALLLRACASRRASPPDTQCATGAARTSTDGPRRRTSAVPRNALRLRSPAALRDGGDAIGASGRQRRPHSP